MEYRDLLLVKTVEETEKDYLEESFEGPGRPGRGYPSQKTFENMVRTINIFPVTIEDVCNNNTIYGCNVPTLKGKTVRQQPKHVQSEYIEVTDSLMEMIGKLTVAAGVIFVNWIPFLVSVSRGFNLTTV